MVCFADHYPVMKYTDMMIFTITNLCQGSNKRDVYKQHRHESAECGISSRSVSALPLHHSGKSATI